MHIHKILPSLIGILFISHLQPLLQAEIANTQLPKDSVISEAEPTPKETLRDPFSAASQNMGLPIYSATTKINNNPIFKDLIQTEVLALAENQSGERLAFIRLPMGEILSVKENDSFSMQSSDLGINTIQVQTISDINIVVTVDRSEMILR